MTADPTPEPEHTDPEPDEAQPEQAEPETAPEPDETPEQAIEPAEADTEHEGKVIELRTERGALTLRPTQTELDPVQKAALVAIGIDVQQDPGVVPHVRAFMHMCQVKGLDPWAREAYLIGRGTGEYRKYTMQTGIDGYRKMAASTGRFIRVKETLWTGPDDDDRTYRAVDDGKGGVIMRRVWYDQWPASRGYPGAAKVVIEHYDDFGNVVETEAVADWGMYAPFTQAWHWGERKGQKVYETNDDGSPKMVLNDMWAKGYAHMLAKCAEALADRKAFPARMSGVYTHEEMHRLDQAEQERVAAQQREARQAAYLAATSKQTGPLPTEPDAEQAGDAVAGQDDTPSEPITAETVPETETDRPASEDTADPDQRRAWLSAELTFQADVLGHTVSKLASRPMRNLRKNVEDFTDAELLPIVSGLRPAVLARLRQDQRSTEADVYATLGAEDVVNLDVFLAPEAEVVEDAPAPDVDPTQPHAYVDQGGVCVVCGDFEDTVIHAQPEPDATQATDPS